MPKDNADSAKSKPILPIVPDMEEEVPKEDLLSFSLRTDPTDANSPTYKKTIRLIRGNESVREIIKWVAEARSILIGMNITAQANQIAIIKQMLRDIALTTFQTGVDNAAAIRREAAAITARNAEANDALKQGAYNAVVNRDLDQFYDHVEFSVCPVGVSQFPCGALFSPQFNEDL